MLSHPHTICPFAISVARGAPPPSLLCTIHRSWKMRMKRNRKKKHLPSLWHVNLLYRVKINSDVVGPPIAWSSMASFQHANKWCRVIPANTGLARVGREKVHQNKRLAFGIHGRRLWTVGALAFYHTSISICTDKANLFNKTVMKKN